MEAGAERSARWRSESDAPPPARVVIADDNLTGDAAYGLACQGTALLWRGDFQNARQMLRALANRAERRGRKSARHTSQPKSPLDPARPGTSPAPASLAESFHLHRQ